MNRKIKIILAVIFLVIIGWGGRSFFKKESVPDRRPKFLKNVSRDIVVKTAVIKKEDFTFTLDYVGSLKAKEETSVFSKVTGKLEEYVVNEGDVLQKGQTLANIDRDETGLKFQLAKVESPISGIVGRILLDKGANIQPGITALAVVVNMDEMIARLNISEQDIPSLKKGLAVTLKVDAYPDEEFLGEVSRVSEMADPQTRTLPIEITILNKGHRLKSGMFARIKIIAARLQNVLVLNQDAIIQELGEKFVFLVVNNAADKRKVILGKSDDGKIEVIDGVREGDQVIVFGQQGLKDGAQVVVSKE